MENNKRFSVPLFLKRVLNVLIVAGMGLYLFTLINSVRNAKDIGTVTCIITYLLCLVGGASIFGVLFSLKKIVDSLIKRTPFIWDNVNSLKRIAIYCFTIAGTYVVNFIINEQYKDFQLMAIDKKGVHTDFEFLIFFFAGCFIFILSQVFKQAVEYKEENDLTI